MSDGLTAVTVRSATPEAAEVLVELLRGGAIDTSDEDPGDLTPYRAALVEIGESPGTEILVAEQYGQVAGTCQLITFRHLQHRGGRCAEISLRQPLAARAPFLSPASLAAYDI